MCATAAGLRIQRQRDMSETGHRSGDGCDFTAGIIITMYISKKCDKRGRHIRIKMPVWMEQV